MYLRHHELVSLFNSLCSCFDEVELLMDYYTEKAAKLSKMKNPINDVGVYEVFGFDDPRCLENEFFKFVSFHEITPNWLIDELEGLEKVIFKKLYAGNFANGLYKMVEYRYKK